VKSFESKLRGKIATGTDKQDRTALKDKAFWDPDVVFQEVTQGQEAKQHRDIREGFVQLLESIGFASELSDTCERLLTALFKIRNKSLHQIVWDKKKDDKGEDAAQRFAKELGQNGWGNWFSLTRVYALGENGEMVEVEIEDITVERCFADDAFRELEQLGANLAKRLSRLT
jgi:hypothetical protein